MRLRSTLRLSPAAVFALTFLAAGCGDEPSGVEPEPLTITVTGVAADSQYTSAVTIGISTNRGTFQANLDGDLFLDGQTVTEIGAHTLEVSARDGADTASVRIDFELIFEGNSFLIVRMIDLGDNASGGGGDAILVTDSAQGLQAHLLIDAGPAGANGSNPGYVAGRLQQLGVGSLEAVILTHAHTDHYDGLPAVLNGIHVERFIYNGQVRSLGSYNTVLNLANSKADTVIVPADTVHIALTGDSGSTVTVIPPLSSYLGDTSDGSKLNEGSLGALLKRGAFRMFFTGDGEVEANARWRRDFATLSGDVDVLKAGHHGANDAVFDTGTSGSSTWLNHTSPSITLISANGTTHPLQNALAQIMGVTTGRTYCTNVHGDIELRVDLAGNTAVTVEKNADMDCVAGS